MAKPAHQPVIPLHSMATCRVECEKVRLTKRQKSARILKHELFQQGGQARNVHKISCPDMQGDGYERGRHGVFIALNLLEFR